MATLGNLEMEWFYKEGARCQHGLHYCFLDVAENLKDVKHKFRKKVPVLCSFETEKKMGIKDLWSILQPYCERKPLFELQNKRVAIDLSGWVCQAQCIADYQVQPKMYLRNLYFRTCFLVLHDVQMVFVLEGNAPTLKYKTIATRNELQFKGAEPRQQKAQKMQNAPGPTCNKGRSRFNTILNQCKEMLGLMGLACVTGEGEAEAMCAHLNKEKLVDGCISQDSDCFAYGADVVYRNFSISMQGNQASSGGSVDVYDLNISRKEIDFGRNKVIGLALLCGSDYNDGVFGIGKESALRFFSLFSDDNILEEIRSWRTNAAHYDKLHHSVNDSKRCTACSHTGKKATHTRFGCPGCRTSKGCNVNEEHANIRLGLQLRSKALVDDKFPDEELIGEFLQQKDSISRLDLKWKMPDLEKFIDFTRRHLQWEEIYAFEKLFPILTRWLVNNPAASSGVNVLTMPEYIKKKRAPKGIPSYEIVWKKEKLLPLIPPEQIVNDHVKLFASIEPQHLVDVSFPDLVRKFEESKQRPAKTKKRKQLKVTKITDFVSKKSTKSPNDSLFDDVDDDGDLSLIVEEICNRGVPLIFQKKINQLCERNVCQPLGESSFFDCHMNEDQLDAFERSVYVISSSDDDNDEEDEDH